MTRDFFARFCKQLLLPLNEVTIDKRVLVFLEELIFKKSAVYIDLKEEEIIDFISNTANIDPNKNPDQEFFKKLSLNNKVRSCKDFIDIFHQKKHSKFLELEIKPNFLFLSESENHCKGIEEEFGIFCTSQTFPINIKNTFVQVEVIQANIPIDVKSFISYLPKSNAIIIEDPYLFDNDREGDFFSKLIDSLYPKKFQLQNFFVTAIFDNSKGINIKLIEAKIKLQFPKIIFETYLRSSHNMHDRNIFSNSFWISCDYGFKPKYAKPTKWLFFPLGIYYSQFDTRKKGSVRFIENEKKQSQNPLMK